MQSNPYEHKKSKICRGAGNFTRRSQRRCYGGVVGSRSVNVCGVGTPSRELAEHLRALGVGPEVVVGLSLRSPALLLAALATLRAGGAYFPMDPLYPAKRLAFMLRMRRSKC